MSLNRNEKHIDFDVEDPSTKNNNSNENENRPATELDALLERTDPQQQQQQKQNNGSIVSPSPAHQRRWSLAPGWNARFGRRGGNAAARGHRKNRTSLGEMFQSMSEGLETIAEGFHDEAQLLRRSMVNQLQDASEGRTYFFDMTLTRSLSVRPEDFHSVIEEAVGFGSSIRELDTEEEEEAEGKEEPKPTTTWDIVGRYASLLCAVVAVSSNGTALKLLDGVEPPMKVYWRMTATATILSVLAFKTMYYEHKQQKQQRQLQGSEGSSLSFLPRLSPLELCTFLGATVCFTCQVLCMFFAMKYTSIGNAVIGGNSQAILLILGKFLMGHTVLWMEGGGVLIAFAGVLLCSTDEASDDDGEDPMLGIIGDALALTAGVLGVGYLTFAKACRPLMPVTVFMFLVMVLGSILVLCFMLIGGYDVSFSANPYHGMFGWLNTEHSRLYVVLYIAIICNVCGTMGFVRAMQYFENIVIAVATLLEPMIATIIAFLVGVGDLPGTLGWIGNALVAVGTLCVVYPSVKGGGDNSMGH